MNITITSLLELLFVELLKNNIKFVHARFTIFHYPDFTFLQHQVSTYDFNTIYGFSNMKFTDIKKNDLT